MADCLGYVVVEYPPGETVPTDLSSAILHPDNADACWERDMRAGEGLPGTRYMVCQVAEPREEDQ